MEVIARQSERAKTGSKMFVGMGGVGLVADVILLIALTKGGVISSKDIEGAILLGLCLLGTLVVSLFFLVTGLRLLIRSSKLPAELIKYENGEFIFADGYRCNPSDIVEVDYFKGTERMRARRENFDGWISVTTKDKQIMYEQVETVQDVYARLMYYKQNSLEDETAQMSKNTL